MQNTRRAFEYLDVVFLNRNKGYGAYELRTHYPDRLRKAAVGVLFSAGLLALLPILTAAISGSKTASLVPPKLDSIVICTLPSVDKVQPLIEPEHATAKPLASQKVTPPKIVDDTKAEEENVLQQVDSAKLISTVDKEGMSALPSDGGATGDGTGNKLVVGGIKPKPLGDGIPPIVDVMAEFQGDIRAYLAGKLNYPDRAREAGVDGRVVIRFVVDEEGTISKATVARGIGAGCDEEALRVVRSMPRWKPATLNGQVVKSYFSLPIRFTLDDKGTARQAITSPPNVGD